MYLIHKAKKVKEIKIVKLKGQTKRFRLFAIIIVVPWWWQTAENVWFDLLILQFLTI